MTFFDFLKDIIDTGKERLKSPVMGAFVFSFVCYNWRAIALLLFSNASIEDKIVVINYEYCNGWALILPVFIALFYTLLMPKLMVEIDNALVDTKEDRVSNIYKHKTHVIDKRIELARKEFELKNVETGNKQIEDFQAQIKDLEQSKEQIIEANKLKIEEMTTNYKNVVQTNENANKIIEKIRNEKDQIENLRKKNTAEIDGLMKMLIDLAPEDFNILKMIKEIKSIHLSEYKDIHENTIKRLFKYNLIENVNGRIMVSDYGSHILTRMI